jgi:hypothetical protein
MKKSTFHKKEVMHLKNFYIHIRTRTSWFVVRPKKTVLHHAQIYVGRMGGHNGPTEILPKYVQSTYPPFPFYAILYHWGIASN